MREIKFRAWDADIEYMVYSDKPEDNFFFEFGSDGKFRAYGIDYDGDPGDRDTPPGPLSYELLAIMQYTGLKDSKGKEIYELMELNGRYIVIYILTGYFILDIIAMEIKSIGEILENENEIEVTGEYSTLSEDQKRCINKYIQSSKIKKYC